MGNAVTLGLGTLLLLLGAGGMFFNRKLRKLWLKELRWHKKRAPRRSFLCWAMIALRAG
jgi:hypothetical protein